MLLLFACTPPVDAPADDDADTDDPVETDTDRAETGDTDDTDPVETGAETGGETADTGTPVARCDDGTVVRTFDPTGEGTDFGGLSPDFTVPTADGDWTLSDHWTGCDSYVLVGIDPGDGYTDMLLDSGAKKLFKNGPQYVHYFFMANTRDGEVESTLASIEEVIGEGLGKLDDDEADWWAPRVHYVTSRARGLDGWLGDLLGNYNYALLGIDREQTLRELGYLADASTGWTSADWDALGYEADLYAFEAAREDRLDAQDATVLAVFDDEYVEDSAWAGKTSAATVTFPDAATMAGFDTLEVDLSLSCGGAWYESCPAWDYLAYVYLCDADDAATADVDESATCVEMSRFITAYWRGGRWVMDASHWLAYLQEGGDRVIRVYSTQPYYVDLSLRLSNAGSGTVPTSIESLWTGGSFDEDYNDEHPAITFTPPEGTTRVRLVTLITGHGFGAEKSNCAEFCNHQHEFTVNDGTPWLEEFPDAGSNDGCVEQVAVDGVVPNQAGTWPYGRGGWCPGLGIQPWVQDITDQVDLAGENTIAYRGLYEGEPYVPDYDVNNSTYFTARIDMASYLVYER